VLLWLKRSLIALEKSLAVVSLFLLLAFSLVQIVARNFFDFGFTHLDTISRHLVLYLAFMGAALIIEDDRHIKIDILAAFLTDKHKRLLLQPLLLLAAIICAFFAWHALRFWLDEWHYAADAERWQVLMALILPAGFCTLTLHFLLCVLTGQSGRKRNAA
jgi:TRAP-type transport system small permease protein